MRWIAFCLIALLAVPALAQNRRPSRRTTVRRPQVRRVTRVSRPLVRRPVVRRVVRQSVVRRPSYTRGYRSYYNYRPVTYRRPVYRQNYRSRSFGFSFSLPTSTDRPSPVVYASRPVYVESAPVVLQQPVVVVSSPVVEIQPSGFVELERRYHKKGSDAGTLDWIKGRLNGRKVKLYFNMDGTIRKQKYDD